MVQTEPDDQSKEGSWLVWRIYGISNALITLINSSRKKKGGETVKMTYC